MTSRLVRLVALTVSGFLTACTGSVENPGGVGTGTGNAGVGPGSGSGGLGTGNAARNRRSDRNGGNHRIRPLGPVARLPEPSPSSSTGRPPIYRVVRLTNEQWTNSVQRVLGLASPPTTRGIGRFQSRLRPGTDFTNNELLLDVDSRGWHDYQAAAEALAAKVSRNPRELTKVYSGTDGAGFISRWGVRVYRRR